MRKHVLPSHVDVIAALALILPATGWLDELRIHERLWPSHGNPDMTPDEPDEREAATFRRRQMERTRWLDTLTNRHHAPAWAKPWQSTWHWTLSGVLPKERLVNDDNRSDGYVGVVLVEVPIFELSLEKLTLRAQIYDQEGDTNDVQSAWSRSSDGWRRS